MLPKKTILAAQDETIQAPLFSHVRRNTLKTSCKVRDIVQH